jgi:hypothetical protein
MTTVDDRQTLTGRSTYCQKMIESLMNNEFERIWKYMVMA